MKFLSEIMNYYLNYKANELEPLKKLLEGNKKLISIINTKDKDIKIIFKKFHSCLRICCDKPDIIYPSFDKYFIIFLRTVS